MKEFASLAESLPTGLEFFEPSVSLILDTQSPEGAIPWFEKGHLDPWDHIEAAMGLSIAGEGDRAKLAYRWLQGNQLDDGSWWFRYENGRGVEERRESNFSAYIATGVWHHYLVYRERRFLADLWPCVQRAMEFVLALQTRHGDICWAVDGDGRPMDDALVTGCSSIYKSLECGLAIAHTLGGEAASRIPAWDEARARLGEALRRHPERFDRHWRSKARYSMDWFYPVLVGLYQGAEARAHLASRWDEFVEEGLGCCCVADEPWVTVAESCELAIALLKSGDRAGAQQLFANLHQFRDEAGVYWTGWQFVQGIHWPVEKPTWTAAAVLLAADALEALTPASRLFLDTQLGDRQMPRAFG